MKDVTDSSGTYVLAFTWDSTDMRFEATITMNSPMTITFDTFQCLGSEETYDITAGTMNGLSLTLEWYGEEQTGSGGGGGGGGIAPPPSQPSTPTYPPTVIPPSPPKTPWIVKHGIAVISFTVIAVFAYRNLRKEPVYKRRRRAIKSSLKPRYDVSSSPKRRKRRGKGSLRKLSEWLRREVEW